jgi:hypothetical protein
MMKKGDHVTPSNDIGSIHGKVLMLGNNPNEVLVAWYGEWADRHGSAMYERWEDSSALTIVRGK